jgi:hypothetical protein
LSGSRAMRAGISRMAELVYIVPRVNRSCVGMGICVDGCFAHVSATKLRETLARSYGTVGTIHRSTSSSETFLIRHFQAFAG